MTHFLLIRMPFGLFNASTIFQICMLFVFADMVDALMQVFMDDFLVVSDTFESFLIQLERVFQ